jgi:hypothetical protein
MNVRKDGKQSMTSFQDPLTNQENPVDYFRASFGALLTFFSSPAG